LKSLFYFLFIIVLNTQLLSKALDISQGFTHYFGKQSYFLEDKDSVYTIDEVKQKYQNDFKKLEKNVHTHILTNSSFWYRFDINNKTQEQIEKYFVFEIPWLDEIDIYIFNKDEKTHYQLGDKLNFENRSIKTNLLNQKHQFESGISNVYIKVKTDDPFLTPLLLLDKEQFLKKIYKSHIIEFAIFCVVVVMILFNFILYFIIKDSVYIYYVLFLSSFVFMCSSYNGFIFQFLLNNYPLLVNWLHALGIFSFSLTGIMFTRSFLDLKTLHPKIDKTVRFLIVIVACLIFSGFIISYHQYVTISIYVAVFYGFIAIFLGLYSYLKKNKQALFFLVGTLFGVLGTIITAFNAISYIPFSWGFYKAVDFGIIFDAILLSIALANRYNILYKNLKDTEQKLLVLNDNLEDKVETRTKQLHQQLKNRDILLKELSHRVKNNLQIITAFLSMDMYKVDDLEGKEVLRKNLQRIKSIAILYEKFLESKDLDNICLQEYVDEIIKEFETSFSNKKVIYKLSISEVFLKSEVLIPVGLIINELLTNSLKHAFDNIVNPHVNIGIENKNDEIHIHYKDNGIGADTTKIEEGFGFKVLKSLAVHQLSGKLECFNKNGIGFNISFKNENPSY